MEGKKQHIIWPWETQQWIEIKEKIGQPINSFIELDSRISSLSPGKIRPRIFGELFTRYYNDSDYSVFRPDERFVIKEIIPMMQKLIEGAPKLFRRCDSRILVAGITNNIVLNKPQVATILSLLFFNLLNYDYISAGNSLIEDFPDANLTDGFSSQNMIILQCILTYFSRIHERLYSADEKIRRLFETQLIIIKRTCITENKIPNWGNCGIPVKEILIGEKDNGALGTIDDSPAGEHVVFSHEYLGGELFKSSLTQEELTLLIRPEAIPALLFCEKLGPLESVIVLGAEKYSQYSGMGSGVKFISPYIDPAPVGYNANQTEAITQQALIFMDASTKTSSISQCITEFERDLNKAFCGFSALKYTRKIGQIASGGWSCGFLGANMQVKFIQQILAAAVVGKELIYHAGNKKFEEEIILFNEWIQKNKLSVAELYHMYTRLMNENYKGPNSRLNELNIFLLLRNS